MSGKRRPKQTVTVRIVGGALRGRKLVYQLPDGTRPMKDRVREAVFNLLGPDVIPGALVWDLFAGTGALVVEAISRGAKRGVALERDWRLMDQLRRQAETLGIADRLTLMPGRDSLAFGEWPPPGPEHWLVFCCPPYALYREKTERLLMLIGEVLRRAPEGSILVVETDTHFDLSRLPSAEIWRHRAYPPAVIAWTQVGPSRD